MTHADYSESFSGSDATLVPPVTTETVETLRQVTGGDGTSLLRVEDARLLAGGGQFIVDLALPGMLRMRFVRSSIVHRWIRQDIAPGFSSERLGFQSHRFGPSAIALGPKGIGGGGAIGPMAAVANTVADALGPVGAALVSETPGASPRVWAIIEKARSRCNR